MPKHKVAMLTAGGLAPCLSSAVAELIERYSELAPDVEMIGYLGGYRGLLKGESVAVTKAVREGAAILHEHGGSPIGNSRVKLTNVADAVKRGLVKEGELPLQGRGRAAREGRRHHPPHDRRRRHLDHRRRPRKISFRQRLRPDRRRAAENGRQRHRADPPVDGRDDRRRAGRDLFRERRQRGDGEPAHAARSTR